MMAEIYEPVHYGSDFREPRRASISIVAPANAEAQRLPYTEAKITG
jgi:hypothetical protein